jgi:hypothetical protein
MSKPASCIAMVKGILQLDDACIKHASTVVGKEKGGKKGTFSLLSQSGKPAEACAIEVDGCMVQDPKQSRCDYVVHACVEGLWFFVEFKGVDVARAMAQLEATEQHFRTLAPQAFSDQATKIGVIVAKQVPAQSSQAWRNLQKDRMRLGKRNFSRILLQSNAFTFRIGKH